jgi:hypothetical protein
MTERRPLVNQPHSNPAPLQGGAFLKRHPGLKPWAESFSPFGAGHVRKRGTPKPGMNLRRGVEPHGQIL